jgi:hypothetical protein
MEVEKATGQLQPPCWCVAVTFEPAVLAQLPDASRGVACICAACAKQGLGSKITESRVNQNI